MLLKNIGQKLSRISLNLGLSEVFSWLDWVMGFPLPGGSDGKESACNAGNLVFSPWVGKVSWRREWLSTPIFLPEEFHGQESLTGYNPWGLKESDTTEWQTLPDFTCMGWGEGDHREVVLFPSHHSRGYMLLSWQSPGSLLAFSPAKFVFSPFGSNSLIPSLGHCSCFVFSVMPWVL